MASARALGAGVLAVVALLASAAGVEGLRERRYPPPPPAQASLYLTSGAVARRLAVGFDPLVADVYWIRSVLYYGDMKLRLARMAAAPEVDASGTPSAYALLYPLLDLTTSLDPRFNIAYRFGAIFLAEAYPGGPGRPDQAIALLQKGLAERPDKWEYMQDIGFVYYWWYQDYKAAAEWFERASQMEGAPWFLRSLAATTIAAGGDRRSSRLMWQSIHESAESDWLRNDAERRLLQLDTLDVIDQLQPIVDRAAAALPADQLTWPALVRAGLIRGVPLDPTGVPFEIDADGRVQASPQSPLYPLEPPKAHVGLPTS